jgi:amino acid transporter
MCTTLPSDESASSIAPRLGLWDTVSIIVGIVVGTAIFRSSPMVFTKAGGPWTTMALWLAGGALAWCGAVCYAELATTYPRDGGDYEYLKRAFGPWCGFLFAWAQLTAIVSGNIAIMAWVFADYGGRLRQGWSEQAVWLAVGPVVVLSALNALGVAAGKFAQNVLTCVKVAGLAILVVTGFVLGAGSAESLTAATANTGADPSIGLALVFVLYAYGGWSHAAYVAAEVRDQRRNLPRALSLGLAGITLIYLAVNAAYLAALNYDGARAATTPAADILELVCGPWGGRAMSLLVMISALGAINGMVLTASRIYAAWGADYPLLAWLGTWNRRVAAPISAISLQAIIASLLILLVGTNTGRDLFEAAVRQLGVADVPWEQYGGGFETLVAGTAPIYWSLCLMTGIAVFLLRANDRTIERPFRIPLYPLPPLVFAGTCVYMLCASLTHAKWLVLLGLVPVIVCVVVYFFARMNYTAR